MKEPKLRAALSNVIVSANFLSVCSYQSLPSSIQTLSSTTEQQTGGSCSLWDREQTGPPLYGSLCPKVVQRCQKLYVLFN